MNSVMDSLLAVQNRLVHDIKNHREYRLNNGYILAEYPASSGKMFSCSAESQNNWGKLGTLDALGLVSYPFTVTTYDERDQYDLTNGVDLKAMIGSVSAEVLAERLVAKGYIEAVLAATDTVLAHQAAEPYLYT